MTIVYYEDLRLYACDSCQQMQPYADVIAVEYNCVAIARAVLRPFFVLPLV